MGYLSRKPNLNECVRKPNPWGSNNPCYDDIAVLLNGDGERCSHCKRVVLKRHIQYKNEAPYCPDHFPAEDESTET